MKTAARHISTFLGGIGAQLLAHGLISAAQVPGINDAATALTNPVMVVIGLVGALLTRVAIAVISNLLRTGAGETKDSAGGPFPCVLLACVTAGLMGFSLPSCTTSQLEAARAIPIRIGIQGPDAAVSYSSKSGLAVDAVIRAEK